MDASERECGSKEGKRARLDLEGEVPAAAVSLNVLKAFAAKDAEERYLACTLKQRVVELQQNGEH